ncbi:D-2-hydroxyacid dehydrogenase [Hymenobacter sp. GOD-10R]|uniref:D-2-hydroxyacid dehydrogenase n=1 Tax=Hymenobacter sp. GOD-10R TaxID=3093922 RepID=UPI002D767697|nr:D-2-hydroxyacid dehydrogenase [Hymenobacter sp. GOD-10R]WRQ29100.1 D-2-hydroxyacid dehydrogenase [Hymenobacter sp. GOD-10R]
MQLFVYSAFSEASQRRLQQELSADLMVVFRTNLPEDQQRSAFQKADLLFGNPPAAWLTEEPPALQFWQIDSAGFERYTDARLTAAIANMGDFFAWPCAETMVAGILAWYRHIPELTLLQAKKEWVGPPVRKKLGLLRNRRVIILGAGAIGQAVRQQLTGFNCQVQFLARTNPEAQLRSVEDLKAALPQTDIVVNCLPGSAEKFFSADLINAMTPGSLYASVGRGNTTDEPALVAALQAGKLGGAVLDVTAKEPLPADSPLWSLPQVLLTQHTAGGQPGEEDGRIDLLLRNLHHFRQGEPLENPVELSKGY